ncbi:MAG: preprotein translocase subunit SecY [Bacillota bacterium]|nr:preprotein translocase subunit SecY [Bacillota bacterium]
MLSTLRNAWKVPELRRRIIFTLVMVAIFRMGNFIPVPGVDTKKLIALSSQSGSLFGLYDIMSGGAFSKFTIFALGVIPYINASIIMQLLTIAIPPLEQLQKEGEIGRKKIQQYTRYAAVLFGVLGSFTTYAIILKANALTDNSKLTIFLMFLSLTTGSTFLMWLGEKITVRGIGNGVSLLIFVNIVSRFPNSAMQVITMFKSGNITPVALVGFIVTVVALFVAVVTVYLAERRIPIQYAGKTVGGKVYKGQSSHIPININSTGIIAIIFAMAFMQFPTTIGQFFPQSKIYKFMAGSSYSPFRTDTWAYAVLYFVLIIFFTWFYAQVTFKPDEMAENIHKSSGFIPGIRPGEQTARHIERVLARVSVLGGTFAAIIAVTPNIVQGHTQFKDIYFAGTGLLILVGVALDTLRQIESQLVMRHYQGFLSE